MYLYSVHIDFLDIHAALRRPRVLSRAFGCGASKGVGGTFRRMYVWIPADHRVRARCIFFAELAPQNEGLLFASPSRVGGMKNPTFLLWFRK